MATLGAHISSICIDLIRRSVRAGTESPLDTWTTFHLLVQTRQPYKMLKQRSTNFVQHSVPTARLTTEEKNLNATTNRDSASQMKRRWINRLAACFSGEHEGGPRDPVGGLHCVTILGLRIERTQGARLFAQGSFGADATALSMR